MATPVVIPNDVGTLLKIPTKVTNELTDKACLCISSAICDAKRRGDTQCIVNIGIGALSINLVDMQCKFIPGKELKTTIKKTLETQIDPLELALTQTFTDEILAKCEGAIG